MVSVCSTTNNANQVNTNAEWAYGWAEVTAWQWVRPTTV